MRTLLCFKIKVGTLAKTHMKPFIVNWKQRIRTSSSFTFSWVMVSSRMVFRQFSWTSMMMKQVSADDLRQSSGSKRLQKTDQIVTTLPYLPAIVTKRKSSTIFTRLQRQERLFKCLSLHMSRSRLNYRKTWTKLPLLTKDKAQESNCKRSLLTQNLRPKVQQLILTKDQVALLRYLDSSNLLCFR